MKQHPTERRGLLKSVIRNGRTDQEKNERGKQTNKESTKFETGSLLWEVSLQKYNMNFAVLF